MAAISAVIGDYGRPKTSISEDAQSRDPRRSSYTHSTERHRILPPSDIRRGHPEAPTAALFLSGRNWRRVHTTGYYNCSPWPQLLVAAMERWARAPGNYPQRQLPLPELDRVNPATGHRWLAEAGGPLLWQRYRAARLALGRGEPPALPS